MNKDFTNTFADAIEAVKQGELVGKFDWPDSSYLQLGNSYIGKHTSEDGFQYWSDMNEYVNSKGWYIKANSSDKRRKMRCQAAQANVVRPFPNYMEDYRAIIEAISNVPEANLEHENEIISHITDLQRINCLVQDTMRMILESEQACMTFGKYVKYKKEKNLNEFKGD